MSDYNFGAKTNCAHIDLNAIDWRNPYQPKITPNPGCLIVRTNCAIRRRSDNERTFFVTVRDGEREANFISNGSDHITAEDFCSGTNANGHRFFGHNHDLNEVYAQDIRRNAKIFKAERTDMVGFILDCLEVPVIFADEGNMIYCV